ncbi:hypothetical protein BGZ97_002086 [Linnemannia gamsii]|uniref:Zn(2)-C6 fungal-type domain-containing protein n=1 Tax=Linnemannia gamsii TaxID=64522 RepID=A0A9P6QZD2_9FUNG|nr:hypothetical protein BGZ97_002086 [Linnemannia gamsii]
MSTSTLQLLPTTATEIAQLDPATLASIPGVAYDLKRLKVYSSCLRCRAKKVKCDRKEPCSRCVKHSVECSYRELASVQLDIRQFQRHLNNPKIRKDGAGIITSTATPIITLPSGDTAVLSPATTAAATLIAAAKAGAAASLAAGSSGSGSNKKISAEKKAASAAAKSASSSTCSTPVSPTATAAPTPAHSHPGSPASSSSSTDTESDTPMSAPASAKSIAMARAKVHKIIRRKPVVHKPTVAPMERFESTIPQVHRPYHSNSQLVAHVIDDDDDDEDEDEDVEEDNDMDDDDEDEDEIERVVLRSNPGSGPTFSHVTAPQQQTDSNMSSETEDEDQPQSRRRRNNEDVPIWRAKAVGKHKQTVHEQDLAETFGLAAYLQAKESSMDAGGIAGQTIDYDMELERALAQRLPTSFSRPDRSLSRARKYAQAGYNPSLPYARPSHCQLVSTAGNGVHAPVAANCCCQIAAKQGQAPGTCFFSEKDGRSFIREEDSSMSPPPAQVVGYEQGETGRIAYSPSYQPSYKNSASGASAATAGTATALVSPASAQKMEWSSSSSSSMVPPALALSSLKKFDTCSASSSPISSPRIELPPIYLPKLPFHQTTPASSDLSAFQVGRSSTNANKGVNSGDNGGRAPLEIACKFNEPNVDAWDMIEKPLSRTVPITTKRGRSVKMEMNWILS